MQFISFGVDAGHLAQRIAGLAGSREVAEFVFHLEPEADPEALAILREAAAGGWVVEILDGAHSASGVGMGTEISLREVVPTGLGKFNLVGDSTVTGREQTFELARVARVHVF